MIPLGVLRLLIPPQSTRFHMLLRSPYHIITIVFTQLIAPKMAHHTLLLVASRIYQSLPGHGLIRVRIPETRLL